MIDEIIENLENQCILYSEELDCSSKKLEAIRINDVKKLYSIVETERIIGSKIKQLEGNRLSIMGDKWSNLKEFAYSLDDQNKKKELLKLREKLLKIIVEIKSKNDISSDIIDVSAGVLDKILKKITQNKQIGYCQNKQKTKLRNNNLLDKKI